MVNVYSTDQNERMERLDRISSLVGNYLLRGYKMLADECETCHTVLLENRRKETYCVGCQEVDLVPDNEQPVVQAPATTTVITDVPVGTTREDLYAMLSQQAAEREQRELRRTPSPPPRLVAAAQSSVTRSGTRTEAVPTQDSDAVDLRIMQSIRTLCTAIDSADHSGLANSAHLKDYSEAILNLKNALK
ncbi:uncharacterized protein LOC134819969 [Bolinopsis microptera]|uniref:uncharacterized protein LOC134819955 n=1 Tax=Bolinopsis microptera TaxID=2820187 RepID=UPI003078D5F8